MNIVEYWNVLVRNKKFRKFAMSIIRDIIKDIPKAEPITFSNATKRR